MMALKEESVNQQRFQGSKCHDNPASVAEKTQQKIFFELYNCICIILTKSMGRSEVRSSEMLVQGRRESHDFLLYHWLYFQVEVLFLGESSVEMNGFQFVHL